MLASGGAGDDWPQPTTHAHSRAVVPAMEVLAVQPFIVYAQFIESAVVFYVGHDDLPHVRHGLGLR